MTPISKALVLTRQAVPSQALALVPLVVGLLLGAIMLPRSVAPDGVPSPSIDVAALAVVAKADDLRAAKVAETPLSSPIRAVGSAFRDFNLAESQHADADTIATARTEIIQATAPIRSSDIEAMLDLRAFQERAFLAAVRDYERTGEESTELRELGGTFIERMTMVGWIEGRRVSMPDAARRVAFKLTWNRTLLMDGRPEFAPTIDESRTLYAFYFSHPHAPQTARALAAASLETIADAATRERAETAAERATGAWLVTKVGELARIDASYPAPLGLAAALYMKGDYRSSANQYRAWLDAHPNGPWTLRAENHLRAALVAAEVSIQ